jgi:predicted ATPase
MRSGESEARPNWRASRQASGYRMIESLEIRNFRGFASLDVADLRRINVIAGANAAGKTALLEALVLGMRAVPNVFGQLQLTRGVQSVMPGLPQLPFGGTGPFVALTAGGGAEQFRAMVDGLFHNYKTDEPIEIRYIDSSHKTFEAKFGYDLQGREITLLGSQPGNAPFRIDRSKNGVSELPIIITMGPSGQMQHEAVNTFLGPNVMFFPSYTFHAEWDNVGWFSSLSQQNKEKEVISIVSEYFPAIKSLSILSPPMQPESIWADLGSKKLPVSMVSSGLHRFISILLGMVSVENGVVVIDELENGMYYGLYPKLWKLLLEMAIKNNNQVFVSTHSLECLKALAPAIKKSPADACMLRVSQEDGDSVVYKLSDNALMAGLTGNVEMRG